MHNTKGVEDMNMLKKIVTNVLGCAMLFLNIGTFVYAGDGGIVLDEEVTQNLTEITQVLLIIGAGVCIAKCIHIGILYTMSSAAEKSNAKSAMLPWIIGTIVCFGAATIGSFVINTLKITGNVLDY